MSEPFITNTITIRGKPYLVCEMDAQTMKMVREMIATDKHRSEAFITLKCCVEPKFSSEAEILKLPQIIADKVSSEAFRLTGLEEETKNV